MLQFVVLRIWMSAKLVRALEFDYCGCPQRLDAVVRRSCCSRAHLLRLPATPRCGRPQIDMLLVPNSCGCPQRLDRCGRPQIVMLLSCSIIAVARNASMRSSANCYAALVLDYCGCPQRLDAVVRKLPGCITISNTTATRKSCLMNAVSCNSCSRSAVSPQLAPLIRIRISP